MLLHLMTSANVGRHALCFGYEARFHFSFPAKHLRFHDTQVSPQLLPSSAIRDPEGSVCSEYGKSEQRFI